MNDAKEIFDFVNGVMGSKEVISYKNENLNLRMRTILNDDGSISINAEDTAIGFGWHRDKNGKNYVMWDRFNRFCEELDFPHKCGKDDYIPESLFYMLGMKANNEKAQKFQQWLALEVIPSIRKTGSYHMGIESQNQEPSFRDYLELIKIVATCEDERYQTIVKILRSMGICPYDDKVYRNARHTPKTGTCTVNDDFRDFILSVDVVNRQTSDVYNDYISHCERDGLTPVSKIVFSKWVNKIMGTHTVQRKINGINRKLFQ